MNSGDALHWQDLAADHFPVLPANVQGQLSWRVGRAGWPAKEPVFLVSPGVLTDLEAYFSEDRRMERLALLLGSVWRTVDATKILVWLSGHVSITQAETSPVHVRMAAIDWPGVWRRTEGKLIVGWAHSHPGHGIRPSSTDLATQRCWFAQPWALALIFDPCAGTSAAYAGAESCPVVLQEHPEIMALLS